MYIPRNPDQGQKISEKVKTKSRMSDRSSSGVHTGSSFRFPRRFIPFITVTFRISGMAPAYIGLLQKGHIYGQFVRSNLLGMALALGS
eukprot:scaffold763_cov402-Prasinococcus_capsulatus_cf.AAC.3